jgi:hypothetical protein
MGTSAKAGAHQAKPSMNSFRPKKFLCGFWKLFNAIQDLNKLESHQTAYYAVLRANKLPVYQTTFYVLNHQCWCGLAPPAITDGPPLSNLVFQNLLRGQREIWGYQFYGLNS